MTPTRAIRTAAMLLFPPAVNDDADILGRLANRHRLVIVKPDYSVHPGPAFPDAVPDYARFVGTLSRVKAISPRPGRLLYVYGLANRQIQCPDWLLLTDDDLIHRPDGTPVTHVEPQETQYVNLGRVATREKLRAFWRDWCAQQDVDGLCFDTFEPYVYAGELRTNLGCPTGAQDGSAVHTPLWWAQVLRQFCAELRWDLEQDGRQLWVNGLTTTAYPVTDPAYPLLGPGFSWIADVVTGVLDEHVHRAHLGESDFQDWLSRATAVIARRRGYLMAWQPRLFENTDPGHVWTSTGFEHFALASALLVGDAALTYFAYHDAESYRGFLADGTPHLYDGGGAWDADLGAPRSGIQWNAPAGRQAVAWRDFDKAIVGVNPRARVPDPIPEAHWGFMPIPVGRFRYYDPAQGAFFYVTAPGPGLNIAPGDGIIVFKV